ncbi:MAG: hypothetical protein HY852_11485 [Bradyrhizobium sp.]|uniref:hypothetical protein n=1 Tax=Bradyrhizobium sp. TaxID=376 RepID=UPI0025B948B4|nr:hypothetical protein [Bradyrhizobium sp.]MBI5262424.1 hypothetical protein [Bradyrhizobium sp.]
MAVLINFGITASLWRAQFWALQRPAAIDCLFGDLRLAVAAFVSWSIQSACEALFRSIACRAFRGARFVHDITAAATMVAAARR